jgi:glycosyltransferase involved in cell wall biosynthesis
MRIIHVVPGLVTESSGPTHSVTQLAASLRALGCQADVAALRLGGSIADSHRVRQFPVSFGMRKLGVSRQMRSWLDAEATSGTVDLLHSHGLWMMPNVYPGWTSRRHGIPLLVSPRGTLSEWAFQSGSVAKPAFWRFLQRAVIEQAAVVHVTSQAEFEDVRRRGFTPPIALIPNGVGIPDDGRIHADARRPTIGYLGRLHPTKRLEMLFEAWLRIERRYPEWSVEIAGPHQHPYATQLQRLALSMGLERVRFRGELVGEAKLAFLRTVSITVLPTHSENFGMSVAESLACGTPAIVTRGAPWGGLDTEHAGWWIEGSTDALEHALVRAMETPPQTLSEMGSAGRCWMERDFSWRRIGEMMHATYGWITGNSTRPSWVIG